MASAGKLSSVEVALLLERIKPAHPEEVKQLNAHIDRLTVEDSWTVLVREVVDAVAASRAAEDRTAEGLALLKPLIERTTEALERMAEQERRRNDLEERRVKFDEQREQRQTAQIELRYKSIFAPVVTALCSALITAAGFYWGSSQ
jgi:hypothetical protein